MPTRVLRIAGTGLAGQSFTATVPAGHCVRIMTGAVMPAGLDTVVPQEFTQSDGEQRCASLPASCAAATTGA